MRRKRSARPDAADEFSGFIIRPDRPIHPVAVIVSAVLLVSIAAAALIAADFLFGTWLWPLAGHALEAIVRWPALTVLPFIAAVLWKARR